MDRGKDAIEKREGLSVAVLPFGAVRGARSAPTRDLKDPFRARRGGVDAGGEPPA